MKVIVMLTEKEKKISSRLIANLKMLGWGIDDQKLAAQQLIESANSNEFNDHSEGEDNFTEIQDDIDFYAEWSTELEDKFDWNNGSLGGDTDSSVAVNELMAAHYMALAQARG